MTNLSSSDQSYSEHKQTTRLREVIAPSCHAFSSIPGHSEHTLLPLILKLYNFWNTLADKTLWRRDEGPFHCHPGYLQPRNVVSGHGANQAILITPNEDTIACTQPYALQWSAFLMPSTATDCIVFLVVISCLVHLNPSPDATGLYVGGTHSLQRTRRSDPNSTLSRNFICNAKQAKI